MHCLRCGFLLTDQPNYCPKCGAVVSAMTTDISEMDRTSTAPSGHELPAHLPATSEIAAPATATAGADRLGAERTGRESLGAITATATIASPTNLTSRTESKRKVLLAAPVRTYRPFQSRCL